LYTKVLQGSVATTRLRCHGIFNDQFIIQKKFSLLSPKVKKIWKSVNICRSYGQLSRGRFYETRCRRSTGECKPPRQLILQNSYNLPYPAKFLNLDIWAAPKSSGWLRDDSDHHQNLIVCC